jgi:hypothetical protein
MIMEWAACLPSLLGNECLMNRLSGVWLRDFVWMVAIMLPIQPLAASHCSCCHSADSSATAGKSSEAEHIGCQAGHCGCASKHKQQDHGPQAKVPFGPCECPANCPCHLQHAPKLAVKTQEVQIEKCDTITLFVVPVQRPVVAHEIRQALISIQHDLLLSETALELCAALCRFTI